MFQIQSETLHLYLNRSVNQNLSQIKHRANHYGTMPTLLTHVCPTCLHRLLETLTHVCPACLHRLLKTASFPCPKAAEEAAKLILDQSERSRRARNSHTLGTGRDTLSRVLLRSLWPRSHPSSYP